MHWTIVDVLEIVHVEGSALLVGGRNPNDFVVSNMVVDLKKACLML